MDFIKVKNLVMPSQAVLWKREILWMIDDILPLNIVQTALSLTKLDRFTLTEAAERASG